MALSRRVHNRLICSARDRALSAIAAVHIGVFGLPE
jgi:hypothetical protein